MDKYDELMQTVPLFEGVSADELRQMLGCLEAETKTIPKNGIVLLAGEKPLRFGVVLTGRLHIVEESYHGDRAIMAVVTPGEVFAETLCCAGVDKSPFTVLADEDTAILLLSFRFVLRLCPQLCPFHQRLIENMLVMIAKKNLILQSKLSLISMKSIREKVLRYLETLAPAQGRTIVAPFSQTKLAEYLGVERSALAHELARMKRDGLIDYKRNTFTLL